MAVSFGRRIVATPSPLLPFEKAHLSVDKLLADKTAIG